MKEWVTLNGITTSEVNSTVLVSFEAQKRSGKSKFQEIPQSICLKSSNHYRLPSSMYISWDH